MAGRKVIRIDEAKCDGCGACVTGCAGGAIALVEGKARLVSEVSCDGLGACLGECPRGAIRLEEREAAPFDPVGAAGRLTHPGGTPTLPSRGACCPGSLPRLLTDRPAPPAGPGEAGGAPHRSELTSWPVQLALLSPLAPELNGAELLLAADCVPCAHPDFHRSFLRGRRLLIACPKLDETGPHLEKLTQILRTAEPRSLTVLRMEVPCCGGLTRLAVRARELAGSRVPIREAIVGIRGELCETRELPPRAA